MSLLDQGSETRKANQKTVFRNTTCCFKLTPDEAKLLDDVARSKGLARSEWMRQVILRELRREPPNDPSLPELVGIRLLLVNVLRPLAAGQTISPDAFDKLLDEISGTKYSLAQRLAAERGR
jgi:hypothetical protein